MWSATNLVSRLRSLRSTFLKPLKSYQPLKQMKRPNLIRRPKRINLFSAGRGTKQIASKTDQHQSVTRSSSLSRGSGAPGSGGRGGGRGMGSRGGGSGVHSSGGGRMKVRTK